MSKPIMLRLDKGLQAEVEQWAAAHGKKVAIAVRLLIREALPPKPPKEPKPPKLERVEPGTMPVLDVPEVPWTVCERCARGGCQEGRCRHLCHGSWYKSRGLRWP